MQVLGLVLLGVLVVLAIVGAALGSDTLVALIQSQTPAGQSPMEGGDIKEALGVAVAVIVLALLIGILFQVWFFTVVLAAFRFLKEKASYTGSPSSPLCSLPSHHQLAAFSRVRLSPRHRPAPALQGLNSRGPRTYCARSSLCCLLIKRCDEAFVPYSPV